MDAIDFEKKYNNPTIKSSTYNSIGVEFFLVENKYHQIIIFRGTSSLDNLKTNSHFHEAKFNGHDDIDVHRGFYEVAVDSKQQLQNILSKDKKSL